MHWPAVFLYYVTSLLVPLTKDKNPLFYLTFTFVTNCYQAYPEQSGLKMAAIAFFVAIGLLCYASAENVSTPLLLPNGLFNGFNGFFYGDLTIQTFIGQMAVTDSTTYYTLDCGSTASSFWPGPDGCINSNSYTFSASSANTRFLMPK